MFPGMNPRKMQQMMKKMGVSQVEIPATTVTIKTEEKELVFENPQVSKVNMMGQETYQIVGTPVEKQSKPTLSKGDIDTVMQQANVDEETAKKAIEESDYDLAKAILKLKE